MQARNMTPGVETWMTLGRCVIRYQSTLMDKPRDSSSVGEEYNGSWKPITSTTCIEEIIFSPGTFFRIKRLHRVPGM